MKQEPEILELDDETCQWILDNCPLLSRNIGLLLLGKGDEIGEDNNEK